MSANAGPDIIEDGIVFYYDTGNTVKSYIGEPTTNYYNSFSPAMPNLSGGNVTTDLPDGTTGTAFRVNVNSNSNTSRCVLNHNLPQPIPQANVRYTISHWIRTISSVPVAAGWEAEVGASDGYSRPSFESGYIGDYGSFTQPNTITSTWTRVSYTFYYTTTKTSALVPFIYFGSPLGGSGDSIGASIDFYGFQIEVNPHVTQYTPSSRSVTQGLLDMARNGTINLTDASFTPNAQLTFDGTNDTVSVNSYPAIELVDNVSVEYVYMRLATDPILDVIANKYHSTGWELFCTTANTFALAGRNGDGTYYSTSNAAYVIENNKYYHLIAMKEGLSWRLYVNGELYASLTANTTGTWSNTGILQIGGEGAGYYPSMNLPLLKIYNRVLSASEVLTNYNAFKSRFGI